jgi:hypothetical protein
MNERYLSKKEAKEFQLKMEKEIALRKWKKEKKIEIKNNKFVYHLDYNIILDFKRPILFIEYTLS